MIAENLRTKVVVVGTGAGGAVAADVLARSGIDTVIVEQGEYFKPGDCPDMVTALSKMYVNSGCTVTYGRPPIAVPLGKAVGGSTIVNSSTCFRPPREKVAAWGGPAYEEYEPFIETVESRIHATVVDETLLGGNCRVAKRGCDKLGIELKPLVHNINGCKGRGACQWGCREGAKQSTEVTFIPSAVAAGARLLTSHKLEGLIIEKGKLAGIRGSCPAGPFEVRADVVVLALGALATPAFLLAQQFPNRSRQLGRNLHIHPACRVVGEFDEIVDGFIGISQGAYIDKWQDRGIILETIFTPPGVLLASMPGSGTQFATRALAYRRYAAMGVMVSDTSSGRVTPGRMGAPFTACYQLNQADAESLRFGIARIAEIYFAAGTEQVYTNCYPKPILETLDDLAKLEKRPVKPTHLEMMAFHPTGTCAMGSDPAKSVVDFALKSHEMDNLYIMDASVVPTPIGVNPQVTIMTLAMRAATLLANKCP